jgi:O-antigen/teichoic acid export membrane protein
VSREVILLLAGPKWLQSALSITFIAPSLAIAVISMAVQALLLMRGAVRAFLIRDIFNIALRIPVTLFLLIQFGFVGVLWARMISGVVFAASNLVMLKMSTGFHIVRSLVVIRRSAVAVAGMAAAILFLSQYLAAPPVTDLTQIAVHLACKVVLGVAVYAAIHLVLWGVEGRPDGIERFAISTLSNLIAFLRARVTKWRIRSASS